MKLTAPVNLNYIRLKGGWGSYAGHRGMDYGWVSIPRTIEASLEVRAAAPGIVVAVNSSDTDNNGWGLQVIIKHTSEAWTTYNHFRPGGIAVRVGQVVSRNQYLGRMGNTGRTYGTTHLPRGGR